MTCHKHVLKTVHLKLFSLLPFSTLPLEPPKKRRGAFHSDFEFSPRTLGRWWEMIQHLTYIFHDFLKMGYFNHQLDESMILRAPVVFVTDLFGPPGPSPPRYKPMRENRVNSSGEDGGLNNPTGRRGFLILPLISAWWFQIFFYVHPYLRKWSNLTNIHQLDKDSMSLKVGWLNSPI